MFCFLHAYERELSLVKLYLTEEEAGGQQRMALYTGTFPLRNVLFAQLITNTF